MNYKKIFNYDNFHKHKLEYIIVILLISLISYLIYLHFKKKYNHKHYESFQNNNIDVLLGENRTELENKEASLQIIYGNSNSKDIDGLNNEGNTDNIFLIYKTIQNDSKYLGDLMSVKKKTNISSFSDKKYVLNPIIDDDKNAVQLTNEDLKNNGNALIIKSPNKTTASYNLFNKLNLVNNNNILELDLEIVYNFLNNNNNNKTINTSEISDMNIFYEIDNLSNINKQNIIDYKNDLNTFNSNFNDHFKNNLENIINTKKSNINTSEKLKNKEIIIPGGHYINFNDKNIFFVPIQTDYDRFYLDLDSNNDISQNNENITYKNYIMKNSRIVLEDININGVILEKFPFLIIKNNNNNLLEQVEGEDEDTELGDNNINYNMGNIDINSFSTFKNKIYNKLSDYIEKLNGITKLTIDDLEIPLQVFQTKTYDETDEHIIFGDIIKTRYDDSNTLNENDLNNYVKIPVRCCRKIIPEITYGDITPITIKSSSSINYEIYKHPIYNTFKIIEKSDTDRESILNKPLYEIIPCSVKITKYQDKIEKFNSLKKKCNTRHKINKDLEDINSFNNLQIKTKINEINENETILYNLRNDFNTLQKEIDRKNILKEEYNRSKLQNYNDKREVLINRLTKKLSNNNLDINILYTDKIIQYLKQKCKNNELIFCKKNETIKTKLLENIDKIEEKIEENKSNIKEGKITSEQYEQEDKEIQQNLINIIKECRNLDGLSNKAEFGKCYQCNLFH